MGTILMTYHFYIQEKFNMIICNDCQIVHCCWRHLLLEGILYYLSIFVTAKFLSVCLLWLLVMADDVLPHPPNPPPKKQTALM